MQFHFNLIKKFAELFFFFTMFIPTTKQQLDSKLHNHIASLLHVLVFVGHLQGGIITEQNMDNIKFTDAKQAKTVYNYRCTKEKNYLAAWNTDITFSLLCYSLKNDDLRQLNDSFQCQQYLTVNNTCLTPPAITHVAII